VQFWFKQRYVGTILSGEKTDTIRPLSASRRLPAIGEQVALSVGPRSPFATVVVEAVESVDPADLPADRAGRLAGIYGGEGRRFMRLRFRVVKVFDECPEVRKLAADA
jgi:hypothetical protein